MTDFRVKDIFIKIRHCLYFMITILLMSQNIKKTYLKYLLL